MTCNGCKPAGVRLRLLWVLALGLWLGGGTAWAAEENSASPASSDSQPTYAHTTPNSVHGGTTDPFIGINRGFWWFNYEVLDKPVLRPVVHSYVDWVPEPVRDGVGNFANNFEEPSSFVNNLLLAEFSSAGATLFRFTVNSTVGLLGFIDVAGHLGVERRPMSMSTVLGKAHMEQGPYFMLPLYGPTTLRGLIGRTVDTLYFPWSVMSWPLTWTVRGMDGLTSRTKVIDQEPILDNALDPYQNAKDFYLQHEQAKVFRELGQKEPYAGGSGNETGLEDYLDEIDQ